MKRPEHAVKDNQTASALDSLLAFFEQYMGQEMVTKAMVIRFSLNYTAKDLKLIEEMDKPIFETMARQMNKEKQGKQTQKVETGPGSVL